MSNIFSSLSVRLCLALNANALTYEEAVDSINALPQMKWVDRELITGDNDFKSLGITDVQLVVFSGEYHKETAPYFNEIYNIIGQFSPTEMVQSYMSSITGSIMAIFAKPISDNSNRILILADSAGSGVTEAVLGYIDNDSLESLRNAILVQRPTGGTSIYVNVANF